MTEQEAQVLAVRLTRIWESESIEWKIAPNPPVDGVEGFLYLNAVLSNLIQLSVEGYCWGAFSIYITHDTWSYGLVYDEQGYVDQSDFLWPDATEEARLQSQFVAEWMPFFRRGCWLSGCAIEASAHEKAEWMQEFTREEIEAWNLKI